MWCASCVAVAYSPNSLFKKHAPTIEMFAYIFYYVVDVCHIIITVAQSIELIYPILQDLHKRFDAENNDDDVRNQ